MLQIFGLLTNLRRLLHKDIRNKLVHKTQTYVTTIERNMQLTDDFHRKVLFQQEIEATIAVTECPDDAGSHIYHAMACIGLGRFDQARAALQKVISLGTPNEVAIATKALNNLTFESPEDTG